MNHRRRRISRVLLAVLALTILVGLLTYAHKLSSRKALARAGTTVAPATTGPAATTKPATPTTNTTVAAAAVELAAVPLAAAAAPLQTTTPQALVTETPSAAAPGAPAAKLTREQSSGTPRDPGTVAAIADKPVQVAASSTKAVAPSSGGSGGASSPTAPAATGVGALAQGRAKMQAGSLLEARDLVNGALASGRLSAADTNAARQLLSEINQTVVFSSRRFADDKWGGTYSVQPGDRLDRIGAKYGLTPDMLMKLNGISDARRLRAGATIKVLKGPFHAVVNKNAFRLDLYLGAPGGDGAAFVTSYPVALGKDDSTPKGKWVVEPQKKLKNPEYYSPRGEGVIAPDDPKNPLGEFWIGLEGIEGDAVAKQSYGIHGTIEPDSIGKQASMGCIRMRNEDVAVVFSALVEGKSTVVVVD